MDIKKINYKSDFTLRMHSDAGWGTGFRIRFRASGSPQKRYCACHDGNGKYCSCHVDAADPSTLVVEFDDHHMGIGVLLCEITYSVADESSPTGKFDTVVNEAPVVATIGGKEYKVILGIDGDESAEIIYELPAYVAEEQRQAAEAERQEAEAGREEAEAVRQELAAHPLYVGEDYFVYQYDLASHEYQNTGVYLKGSVSIEDFVYVSETETHTTYSIIFSDGTTESVDIPKGAKGDKGDPGNPGPQGAQGPKGDTVTATDYTLYNAQGGSSEGAMSQDATTKAISAQTGYYTCGTVEGTAEKVVTVESGNLYKRTLGGHFKVKMTNKNTAASGVTLQIGSETAAALWYNGAAASADNSWEEDEVISVYYDGTYYQASNAQGGEGTKCIRNELGYDLDISDENGNVLARFKDGGFEVLNFNSADASTSGTDNTMADLSICDENGNILVVFSGGHIRTKNFNSRMAVLQNKKVAFLGDSITEQGRYVTAFQSASGCVVYNYGVGGTHIAKPISSDTTAFEVRYALMSDDADVIIVFGGTNDFGHSSSHRWNGMGTADFGTYNDGDNENIISFYAGLHRLFKGLSIKYDGKPIFIVTPIHHGIRVDTPEFSIDASGSFTEVRNATTNKTFREYVAAIKEVASFYSIQIIDAYSFSRLNPVVNSSYFSDGLHLNQNGGNVFGSWLYRQILNYL